jgi:hypothetical protein
VRWRTAFFGSAAPYWRQGSEKQSRETVMATITKSQVRRATATFIISCVILLPAFIGRAPAQSVRTSTVAPVAVASSGAAAL